MTVFEAVKQTVTARQAAENYGIDVNRAGKAQCPFHNDRTPSMKLDKRFHCFGCGADGDVIDFTAKLYGLDPKSAAEKLAAEFQISYTHHKERKTAKKFLRISPCVSRDVALTTERLGLTVAFTSVPPMPTAN